MLAPSVEDSGWTWNGAKDVSWAVMASTWGQLLEGVKYLYSIDSV